MHTHKVIYKDGSEWGRRFTGTSEAVQFGQRHPNVETIITLRGTVEYGLTEDGTFVNRLVEEAEERKTLQAKLEAEGLSQTEARRLAKLDNAAGDLPQQHVAIARAHPKGSWGGHEHFWTVTWDRLIPE